MRHSALGGLFIRKARWGLSARGWLITILLFGLLAVSFALFIFPFLAITHRVSTDVLVVEGWMRDYAITAAAGEFFTGRYKRVFATGGPVTGRGGYVNDFQTSASVGGERLIAAGVPRHLVQIAPSRTMDRDRTYGSALALRKWFQENGGPPLAFNVITEAPHARRTRLLFQKALGREVKVGIIALQNPDYDSKRWWLYSEAVQEICSETLAYLHAKLLR